MVIDFHCCVLPSVLIPFMVAVGCGPEDLDDRNLIPDAGDTETESDTELDMPDGGGCDEVSCGDDATCALVDDESSCVCDDGFLGDGDDCQEAGDWIRHEIGNLESAIYVATADVDGDGQRDVIATSSDHQPGFASEIAWFRNTGNAGAWTKFIVSPADVDDPVVASNGVAAGDVNKDGLTDVVVASGPTMSKVDGGVYLFLRPVDLMDRWEKIPLIRSDSESFFKIYTIDVDRDDYLDVVAGGTSGGFIALNPGADGGDWQTMRMNEETGGGLFAGDFDGDGNVTVLSANAQANKVFWTDVFIDGDAVTYREILVAELTMPLDVYPMDVNRDGRIDILCSRISGMGVHWFENPGDGSDYWEEHAIRKRFSGTDIYVGDIDRDGMDDALFAGLTMMASESLPPSIAWYSVTDDPSEPWDVHWVNYNNPILDAPGDVELFDMNNDGKLDIVTTSVLQHKVYWYENALTGGL